MTERDRSIGSRYRLVEPVGQGGMGRVWRGVDETLDREVAIKEIVFPLGLDDGERELICRRMVREARAAARLNHPSIVTVHDVVEHRGAPVIVMEFVVGQSLATAVRKQGRLPLQSVVEIGAAVLGGLSVAHAAGVVHRDLKPDNILLADGRVVLTDFGIASVAGATTALTGTGMVLGTPAYMAPEQLNGKPASAASDLWSLGATLYHAVEGQPPFAAPTLTALYVAILTQDPRPAEHAGALAPILTQLLVKDPAQRITSQETARALSTLLSSKSAGSGLQANRSGTVPATRIAPQPQPSRTEAAARESTAETASAAIGSPAVPSRRRPARRTLLRAGLGVLAAGAVSGGIMLYGAGGPRTISTDVIFDSHAVSVYTVAFSPDGKSLAVGYGSPDDEENPGIQAVKLWDVETGENTATFSGHDGTIHQVAFSPDGGTLASGGWDEKVELWDLGTREHTSTLAGEAGTIWWVGFSPDGMTLATSHSGYRGEGGDLLLWDVATGEKSATLTGHTGPVYSVAFSPDGRTLATSGDRSGNGKEGIILLWDVAAREKTATLTGGSRVLSVAFSPDGRTLASGGWGDDARLWDVGTRENTATLTGHTGPVYSVAFSPNGRTVATGSFDKTARLWDVS